MLHLHFAPSADNLVPILLEKLRAIWTDPFGPPSLLVPSPAMGKWLAMRLADSHGGLGCTANIKMLTLERYLWDVLQPADTMQLLDVRILGQVVCALLDDNLLKDPCYGPVSAYLKNSEEMIDPVKKVQLSFRIARQFEEYEFNRPSVWNEKKQNWKKGIDATWLDGLNYGNDSSEDAAWQRDLYCKAHEILENTRSSAGVRYLSLPHLYRQRRDRGLPTGAPWTVRPGHIFLFGVSKVSHFHRNTLVEISRMAGVDMQVFLTNPCAEFWEDVDTWRNHRYPRKWRHDAPAEKAGVPSRNASDYEKSELEEFTQLPEDPRLLELWGRAGKENIFLWCPQAEWHFEYYCPEEAEQDLRPPESLLKAVQKALLRRESNLASPAGNGEWKNDGSLQVLACPDPAREVEELREQILDLIAEEGRNKKATPLYLNDIVVYLPDSSAYLAQIHRVFGAFSHSDPAYIPYVVLGAPGSDSLFAQGMNTLLDIVEGRFDRARIFMLLRNPIVQTTRAIAPEKISVWEGWAGELGIFRGFNKEHREQMGDRGQTVTDVHTFELGMARLLLGNLAAGPVELRYRLAFDAGSGTYSPVPPFQDFDTSDAGSVEQFCSLVEELYIGVEGLTGSIGHATLSESVDAMAALTRAWLGTVPEEKGPVMAAEERVMRGFGDALSVIKLQEDLAMRKKCPGKKEFVALVKECLPEELPAGSRAWTGGITFAPLRPSMVIPHKVVFALGLGASAFPGTNDNPAWDLLSSRRIVGDADRVRDNRFAFLELLHAAQEKLVLSFRARNMQKEEDLQPSSVVLELESYLKDQGLKIHDEEKNEDRCLIQREIPWIVHESLDVIRNAGRKQGSWDAEELRLARLDRRPKVQKRYGTGGETWKKGAQGLLRTDLHALRKFYANPLEYHLSKTLGIELDEQSGTMGATDEPLQSGPLEMSGLHSVIWTELLGRVFTEDKQTASVDAAALNDYAEAFTIKTHRDRSIHAGSPEAQLGAMERRNLIVFARACVSETLDILHAFGDHKLLRNADLSLLRPGVPGELSVDIGDGRTCTVACRHGLALVPRNGAGTVGIINIRKEGAAKDNPDVWLEGVVQWLAERKNRTEQDITLVQLNYGDGKKKKTGHTSAGMKKACDSGRDIEDWFGGLIRLMLVERCCDHLPFAVVQELGDLGAGNELDLRLLTKKNIEEQLAGEIPPYRCYLEAFNLVEAKIPDVSDSKLQESARDRFAPMLEGWVHG